MEMSEIKNFISVAKTKFELTEQVRRFYGKEISPDFNSLDFWKIDENKVSQLIAFFLDPDERHGQGDIYLRHFLKKFDLEFFYFDTPDNIEVQCELPTKDGRRIDIVIIKKPFNQAIGIENKIYDSTADQTNQLKDYLKFLIEKTNENCCLIYLSPRGKQVSENSIDSDEKRNAEEKGELKFLTYEDDIIDCIHEFSLMTENIRVKSFLNDFEKRLNKMYMGQQDINAKQIIAEYINETQENIKISFLIANSLDDVKEKLKMTFAQQIERIGSELGMKYEEEAGKRILKLTPKNWNRYSICFSYEKHGVLFGVIRNKEDNSKPRLSEIEALLEEELKESFIVSAWWPMYQFFYSNIERNEQFWLEISNNEAERRVRKFVMLINDNFNTSEY